MATIGNRKRQREETGREEEYGKKKQKKTECFRRNAFLLIKEMVKLNAEHPTWLLDEILHSIFFLGKLDDPKFSPESLASNDDEVEGFKTLKERFPQPFALYSSQVPRRSPFSCVLDMIVHLYGQMDDEQEIIKKLQDFIPKPKDSKSKGLVIPKRKDSKSKPLVSSTICVSQRNIPKSVKYYGVSMSTTGCDPGRIMVAASCLSSWDSYVADAVMTYYPNKINEKGFDGTIELQPHVRCQAFNIRLAKEMPPCRSCGNLFGLETSEKKEWAYGNCAEAESLSNLLKAVEEVRKQVRPTSEKCTDEKRGEIKKSVLTELKRLLRELKFEWDKEKFYDPRV